MGGGALDTYRPAFKFKFGIIVASIIEIISQMPILCQVLCYMDYFN